MAKNATAQSIVVRFREARNGIDGMKGIPLVWRRLDGTAFRLVVVNSLSF
jgi:hypothetical protein